MTTLIVTVVAFLFVIAIGAFISIARIRRKAASAARTTPAGDARTGRDTQVERVAEAYANGEIDERMLGAAARVLGIDKDEARKRLEEAGAQQPGAPARRPVDRDKKRKKNKQARRSRQANRR